MTWEHLHLIAHSFPIVMCVSGTLVGLLGWVRDHEGLETWGIVALLIGGIFVAPAYLTGIAAADIVSDRTFITPGIIQTHRFAATWAAVPVFTAGALAAFSLHEKDDRKLRHFVLIVGLIAGAAVGYAAWLGSKIQHGDRPGDAGRAAVTTPHRPAEVGCANHGQSECSRSASRAADHVTGTPAVNPSIRGWTPPA